MSDDTLATAGVAIDEAEIEQFLRDSFDENYERLRLEGAGALAPSVRESALNQVLLYWRRLKDIAIRVTDTEVRLSLPGQQTAQGREFSIEGVVDIVREHDCTVMYDIKTHEADYVRAHCELYEQQLNVYAHIWHQLRGEPLNEANIIATKYPESLKQALASGNQQAVDYELQRWDPLVPIPFDLTSVEATICEFADVVDAIEDRHFAPPDAASLSERIPPTNRLFATAICLYCDARYSCSSYRAYALGGWRTDEAIRRYFADTGPDLDQENWRSAGLEALRNDEDLAGDLLE